MAKKLDSAVTKEEDTQKRNLESNASVGTIASMLGMQRDEPEGSDEVEDEADGKNYGC